MELTYQREMRLPTQYCALSEEEMIYIDGGEMSFEVGNYMVTFYPENILPKAANISLTFASLLGMGALSAIIAGVVKGYKDGMNISQTFDHFWGRQSTAGKVAAVGVGALAGYYAAVQVIQYYQMIVGVVQEVKAYFNKDAATDTTGTVALAA